MKQEDPLSTLKRFVAAHPTQKEAASALGISQPYLFDLLKGNRPFSERMLQELGLKQIVVKS